MRKLLIGLLLSSTACTTQAVSPTATPTSPALVIVQDTPTPTKTPLPSATPTLEEWIYPYTVEGLREHDYQSGEIHTREILVVNESYTVSYIDYPSDGLTVTGVMYVPVGEGLFPVIVMNHGYFNRADFYSGDGTDRASEYLAQRGYITISPDYRSWGESDIGSSLFYSGLAIDVINLLNAIPSIPQADPSRVGMWGHSMGGGVTMKVLTILAAKSQRALSIVEGSPGERSVAQSKREITVKAAVLYSTVSADNQDLVNRWGIGCFGDIAAGEQLLGCNSSDIIPDSLPRGLQDAYQTTALDPEKLKATSPYYYLSDVTVPLQIHYGTEDGKDFSGTPPEWSKNLHQALVESGKEDVELFAYEGEGHSFFADEWVAFMGRAGQFFDRYVKGTP